MTRLPSLCAVGLLLAVPLAAQDFHWTGTLAAGKRLEIRGINGDVEASLATGNQIDVSARKTGHRSDPETVKIEVVPSDAGVTICAVYPPGRHARHDNSCEPGRNDQDTENNDVTVDFTVKVPAGVLFSGSTVNGDVEATGLKSDADLETVNGQIRASTSGFVEATTVNGSIEAEMGRADWTGNATFTTVNGSVTVTLPANFSAEVRAETVNGDLESDFPLTVTGKFGPRNFHGTIGNGGRKLSLNTVNGSIKLRKA